MGIAPPLSFEDDTLFPDDPIAHTAWELFMDLHVSRRYTDMGQPLGISYREITACGRAVNRRLTPFHYRAVRRLDREYRSFVAERQAERQEQTPAAAGPSGG